MLHLGGVPLEIREFQYDSLIRDVTLTAIHPDTPSASLWDLPKGYRVEEGSDYSENGSDGPRRARRRAG